MSEYIKTVEAKSHNTVVYSVFRGDKRVFSEEVEPITIGIVKTIFLWLFFGFPRVQRALFVKAHNLADKYISVMSEQEVTQKLGMKNESN